MEMSTTPAVGSLPVVADVDLLICGGTAVGAQLALAAASAGASVFLAGSRPYLGEDIAGDLRLWPASPIKGGLAAQIYPHAPLPSRPLEVKLALEQALVTAHLPFLLNALPAGLLRAADGRVVGVRLATRSGFLAVLARLVVDASDEATTGRLAGLGGLAQPQGPAVALHTTLCLDDGSDAPDLEVVARPTGFSDPGLPAPVDNPERRAVPGFHLSARTYRVPVDLGDGSAPALARAIAAVALRGRVPTEFSRQERLRLESSSDHRTTGPDSLPGFALFSRAQAIGGPADDPIVALDEARARAGALVAEARTALRAEPVEVFIVGAQAPASGRIGSSQVVPRSRVLRDLPPLRGRDAWPVLGAADVLVLGGGTAGAPAAIGAARAGASVIVVEALPVLGGVGTAGQISRYWCGNRVGFTSEMDQGVAALEVDNRLRPDAGQWSPSAKAHWLERECSVAGATVLFRALAAASWVEDHRVVGLVVATPHGIGLVRAGCVVDASGCADVAAMAGAPTRLTDASHVAVQGTGLAGIRPGRHYTNSDHNFTDDTDVFDSTAFLVSTKLKFPFSFDAGQLVDSRERRQIEGEIVLGPSDFLSRRHFPDTICVSSSNFDSHGFTVHPLFMCKPPTKKLLWADVPLRALLPRGIERVLVTGLGLSAHRDVLPVVRMQPDVQNHGYAAGRAAALSALGDVDLRALPIRELQQHLVEIGSLPERVLQEQDNFPVADDVLATAVAEGWDLHSGLALLFADPARSQPLLRAAWRADEAGMRRERYALILGLLGDSTGLPDLRQAVASQPWDEGWNYKGMGQFGLSLSPVDVLVLALGRCGEAADWPLLLEKGAALGNNPDFSHVRAVAEAVEALYPRHAHPEAAPLLHALLERPGLSGHHADTQARLQALINDDPNDNGPRNVALRELHLARALYRIGDAHGRGAAILKAYTRDLRAHFARHALAVLKEN